MPSLGVRSPWAVGCQICHNILPKMTITSFLLLLIISLVSLIDQWNLSLVPRSAIHILLSRFYPDLKKITLSKSYSNFF